ncbi:MAG: HEAT repeat domain-containing protein [Thermoguttaceae bacterium]|jgi:HEAT repeat protein
MPRIHHPAIRATVLTAVVALAASIVWAAGKAPPANAAPDKAAVDKAFEALRTYEWGQDRTPLAAIDQAIVATYGGCWPRQDLESRLAAVVVGKTPRAAKDFACRRLSLIAGADSVPVLAGLLTDKDLAHMARFVLERMPDAAAGEALRGALPKTAGALRIGCIVSLGVRRDEPSAPALAALLADQDPAVVAAAATALGHVGTPPAAAALADFLKKAPAGLKPVAADANLACAERLLAAGKKLEAAAIYKSLTGEDLPKPVRVAAAKGLLATAGP